MEKEMERNVQHGGNQKQQWPVYVCMYLFNPGHESPTRQAVPIQPRHSQGTLDFGHIWKDLLTPARLNLVLNGKCLLKALFGDGGDYRTCLTALQDPQIGPGEGDWIIPSQKCIVGLNVLGEGMSMIYLLPSASQQQPGHPRPFLVLLRIALITAISGGVFSCKVDSVIRYSIGTTGLQGHLTYSELIKDGPKQHASQEKLLFWGLNTA